MDDVRSKGQGQIGRYMSSNPGMKSVIEKQLGNVQSSYNSLLNTALQIKVDLSKLNYLVQPLLISNWFYYFQQRLNESLIKFQEYETIIESILQNLKEWEPHISEQLDMDISSVESCKQQLDEIKVFQLNQLLFCVKKEKLICLSAFVINSQVTHAKLQIEKTRLALAVQACEAAAACISRPNTPQDPIPHCAPESELNARTKLEDFLDQVTGYCFICQYTCARTCHIIVTHPNQRYC